MITCPKCGRVQQKSDECYGCGVIFSRIPNSTTDTQGAKEETARPPIDSRTISQWKPIVIATTLIAIAIAWWGISGNSREPAISNPTNATEVDQSPRSDTPENQPTTNHANDTQPTTNHTNNNDMAAYRLAEFLNYSIQDLKNMKGYEIEEYIEKIEGLTREVENSASMPAEQKNMLLSRSLARLETARPIASKIALNEKMNELTAEYKERVKQIDDDAKQKLFKLKVKEFKKTLDTP